MFLHRHLLRLDQFQASIGLELVLRSHNLGLPLPYGLTLLKYYYKMPSNIKNREVFVLDPMLATGGSAIATIDRLKKDGVTKINFLCVIAAPEGVEALKKAHKDVKIYCACIDRCLNENGYILPGLGDAGDRVYGTK